MNIKHLLQTFQTVAHTLTPSNQSHTTHGLVVRTGVRAGFDPNASLQDTEVLSGTSVSLALQPPSAEDLARGLENAVNRI